MPLMGAGDGAAHCSERPLQQQHENGRQQEQSLGAANGSQLRDPNARHGKNNLQRVNVMPAEVDKR